MKLGLNQNARMEQRLVQSPQMIQAMQILQLSTLDLDFAHHRNEYLTQNSGKWPMRVMVNREGDL